MHLLKAPSLLTTRVAPRSLVAGSLIPRRIRVVVEDNPASPRLRVEVVALPHLVGVDSPVPGGAGV